MKYYADRFGSNPKSGIVTPNYAKLPFWLLQELAENGDVDAAKQIKKNAKAALFKGGPGSGYHGHAGRPGEVGGSASGGGPSGDSHDTHDPVREVVEHLAGDADAHLAGHHDPEDWKKHLDENGICHPETVEQALLALHAGKKVDFEQPRQVGTLLHKLAEVAKQAKADGVKADPIDLCGVSVAGTNAFCVGNLGIPRVKMPQMTSDHPIPGSIADKLPRNDGGEVNASDLYKSWLSEHGYTTTVETENAAMLHATQREIDGVKVGKLMSSWDPARAHPIFVSNDNYILDGHHSWAAQAGLQFDTGKQVNVPVARVNANIFELLDLSWTFAQHVGIPGSGM